MNRKGKYTAAACLGLLFLILIVTLRTVGVAAIGPEGTSVGLSGLNRAVHEATGVNMTWYTVTEWLGYLSLLVAALFAATGLMQLLRRKSLARVDREILVLGGLYAAVLVLYALFEKVVVNYRPVIMPGCEHPEASFPSSHTLLVYTVMGSAMMVMGKYVKPSGLCGCLRAICGLIIAVTILGRLISGVHWFTDIVGGLLISAALLALFSAIVDGPGNA